MKKLFGLVSLYIRDWFCDCRKTPLSGNYAGWLTLPNEDHLYFEFGLIEADNRTLQLLGGISGERIGPFSLAAAVTGNTFQAYGQIAGVAAVLNCAVEDANTINVFDATGAQLGIWRRVR